ncbi:MAG: hypothetical protein KJ626_02315 [Verrucomicrobia bacterium]|nr:hypothetical protein [Verrucomicrobiota bacterium]
MIPFVGLCVLLGLGHLLRMKVRLFQKLYLPSCVIGGLLGLVLIQMLNQSGFTWHTAWIAGWGKLPGILINVVFACLFLGIQLPQFWEDKFDKHKLIDLGLTRRIQNAAILFAPQLIRSGR